MNKKISQVSEQFQIWIEMVEKLVRSTPTKMWEYSTLLLYYYLWCSYVHEFHVRYVFRDNKYSQIQMHSFLNQLRQ